MSMLPVFRRLVSQLERQAFRDPWSFHSPWVTPTFGSALQPTEIRKLLEIPKSERFDTMVENLLKDFDKEFHEMSPVTGNEFKVHVDVKNFEPNDITVKIQGNDVVIEGKHEERQDQHGFISRQFSRRYTLPAGIDLEKIKSKLDAAGVLTINAPLPEIEESKKTEKIIEIQREEPKKSD